MISDYGENLTTSHLLLLNRVNTLFVDGYRNRGVPVQQIIFYCIIIYNILQCVQRVNVAESAAMCSTYIIKYVICIIHTTPTVVIIIVIIIIIIVIIALECFNTHSRFSNHLLRPCFCFYRNQNCKFYPSRVLRHCRRSAANCSLQPGCPRRVMREMIVIDCVSTV